MVELRHQPPVGFAGGGEFLVAFFGVPSQVKVFLLEGLDLVVQRGGVGWGAEAGAG